MRYHIHGALSALALASLSHAAPASADTWQEALTMAKPGNKDILLFVHGSDWNRLGEKFRKKIWEAPDFLPSLGDDLVTLRIDYLESPDEDQKKAFDASIKGLKLKFRSYPVLAFYDPRGNPCATWTGSDLPIMSSEAFGLVTHMRTQRKKRDAFLAQAGEQEGVDKAEALYRAAEADAGLRKEIIKQLKECDPDNTSGYPGLLEFNGKGALGQANKLAGEKKFDEALAWLDEQMGQKKLNTEQKQWILAAKGNVYRRWGGHTREMGEAFTAACTLDPESVIGKASARFAKRFAGPPSLEFGWDSRHCTAEPATWTVDASGAIEQPGDYEITLQYKRGKSALSISGVALYDGDTLVHEDQHEGTTGRKSKDNTWHFPVAKALAKPAFRITCHTDDSKNSQGGISVKAVAP